MAGNQGFASMDDQKRKDIASKGGQAAGGKNLTTQARAKGGRRSHEGGNS